MVVMGALSRTLWLLWRVVKDSMVAMGALSGTLLTLYKVMFSCQGGFDTQKQLLVGFHAVHIKRQRVGDYGGLFISPRREIII